MASEHDADEFTAMFSDIYLHLHPRQDPSQYRPTRKSLAVLRHFALSGPVTVKEAALHFGRSQSTMSEIIERLIRHELLVKITDEQDRRRHIVWLTRAGEQCVIYQSQPLDAPRVAQAMSRMPAEARAALLQGMRELVRAVFVDATNKRKSTDDESNPQM